MTQQLLAEKCNLTKSMLSKIENGRASAAVATLSKIAKELNQPLAWLLREEEEEQDLLIIPEEKRTMHGNSLEIGYAFEKLANQPSSSKIEPVIVTVDPDLAEIESYTHEEDEFIFILEGSIKLFYESASHVMHKGDSAYFKGTKPHLFLPADQQSAKVLTIFIQVRE